MAKDKTTSVRYNRQTLQFDGLQDSQLQQLKEAYSQIDVDAELKKMGAWLMSSRGKRRKGDMGFIIYWLNRAPTKLPSFAEETTQSPLEPYFNEYMEELWRGRQHILQFNLRLKKN